MRAGWSYVREPPKWYRNPQYAADPALQLEAKLRLKGMLETFPMTLPWCLGCKHSHLCPCGLLLQS